MRHTQRLERRARSRRLAKVQVPCPDNFVLEPLGPAGRKALLADGYDIRTVQTLLGHRDVRTTMIYTHVLNRGPGAVRSPADRLVDAEEDRVRRATGLPVLGVLHGQPSQAITTGAVMMAGEKGWEAGCLHPLSRRSSLLLRGRASSGWWRYADLSKTVYPPSGTTPPPSTTAPDSGSNPLR